MPTNREVEHEGAESMSINNNSRITRDRLVEALRRELMGPCPPDEVIQEFPTSRYLVGRLAPARETEDDTDAAIEPAENDTLAVGVGDDEDGEEVFAASHYSDLTLLHLVFHFSSIRGCKLFW